MIKHCCDHCGREIRYDGTDYGYSQKPLDIKTRIERHDSLSWEDLYELCPECKTILKQEIEILCMRYCSVARKEMGVQDGEKNDG